MSQTLARAELYTLIWSRPRTALAKEFGISDVAIGKHCVRANIPAPTPGYWARKSAGKSTIRPALPMRLPGQWDEVTIGPQDRHRRAWTKAEDPDQPLLPPVFHEDIDIQVQLALKKIGRIVATRDLSSPHPALKRILAKEARRREQHSTSSFYSYYAPRFDATHHQRQLRIFNSIATALGPVAESQEVYEKDEWIQGAGTVHLLRLRTTIGDTSLDLEIVEPREVRASRQHKGVTATTMRVGSDSALLPEEEWADQPNNKLERQLGKIIEALLYRAERALRAQAQHSFEWCVEHRKEVLLRLEREKKAAEARRLESIAARARKVRQDILDLSRDRRAAGEIREMVAALAQHADLATVDRAQFDDWRNEAVSLADALDPLSRPLADLLKTFTSPMPTA